MFGLFIKQLAEQVHCNQSNFCKLLQTITMDTGLLVRIPFVLQENFFSHLSDYRNDNKQVKNNTGK
jgi:hypothetical protein